MSKELTPLEAFKRFRGNIRWLEENTSLKYFFEYGGLYLREDLDIIETSLERIDYLERVIKDLSYAKDKLIEERTNKIIEHRIVYNDYNFQSIKTYVACKDCQYYENEKCSNTTGCFWLDLEKKLKALEIIKEKNVDVGAIKVCVNTYAYNSFKELTESVLVKREKITQEEFEILKEVLL